MMRCANPSAGFTLIELLVVLGVLGLVLASVISAKPKTSAARLAIAARAITATLQLARARAMSSNAETVVRFDAKRHQFGLTRAMHDLPRGMSVALTVAEPERDGDVGGLRFFADGQSSGGEIVLALDGQSSHIAINWLTGEAKPSQ
jgi:general secretion pathway protein H